MRPTVSDSTCRGPPSELSGRKLEHLHVVGFEEAQACHAPVQPKSRRAGVKDAIPEALHF
eukprot:7538399-Pyramimonas_sp.AAC.1